MGAIWQSVAHERLRGWDEPAPILLCLLNTSGFAHRETGNHQPCLEDRSIYVHTVSQRRNTPFRWIFSLHFLRFDGCQSKFFGQCQNLSLLFWLAKTDLPVAHLQTHAKVASVSSRYPQRRDNGGERTTLYKIYVSIEDWEFTWLHSCAKKKIV